MFALTQHELWETIIIAMLSKGEQYTITETQEKNIKIEFNLMSSRKPRKVFLEIAKTGLEPIPKRWEQVRRLMKEVKDLTKWHNEKVAQMKNEIDWLKNKIQNYEQKNYYYEII